MKAFEARYPGTCADCEEAIAPGDLIRYDYGKPVHDQCDEEVADIEEPVKEVCNSCWVTKPCFCE